MQQPLWSQAEARRTGKQLSTDVKAYGRQQDAVSPCYTPVTTDQLRDGNTGAEGLEVICAYKIRHTYARPYAYLDDLCSVRWHVTQSIAMARQAWRAISEVKNKTTF